MNREVFIPLKIKTHKGRTATIIRPQDYFANTPLSRLLARAEILENQLIKSAENGFTLRQFCDVNKISPRYVRSIIAANCLSPIVKRAIMDGYVPKHLNVQEITNSKLPLAWKKHEVMFGLN